MKEEPTRIEEAQCQAGPSQCDCRMTVPAEKSPGQIAYEAYCHHTGGKSLVTGCRLPDWNILKAEISLAWEAAANAILESPHSGKPFDF